MQNFSRVLSQWLCRLMLCASVLGPAPQALAQQINPPSREDFLTLARPGWVYEVRTARHQRETGAAEVQFNSTEAALGPICVFGDQPHAQSARILHIFSDLLSDIYGHRLAITYAPGDINNCPRRQRLYLRLYSGAAPDQRFNADLQHLDREFDIGFPRGWSEPVRSPGQVNGFFGRRGATAHLLINQPPVGDLSALQRKYHASLLIEELFQAISFGSDILKFERATPFLSKLQEIPVNLRTLPWASESFMAGLLTSTPGALCSFDVFMLHALAGANLRNTNSPALLGFIETHFEQLRNQTLQTLANPGYASVLDSGCLAVPS
jgi:hypothetical protein